MTENTTQAHDGAVPSRIASRYRIEALLGRGGMASVYRAIDETSGAEVALKLLQVCGDRKLGDRSVELFEREFHTLVQLSHPRIVSALDYGVDGGQPYYALELLDGGDLRDLAPLPWQAVCTVAYEICSALSLLHSRGFVHRDLTPRNIRRTLSGEAKLIDFGLLSPMGPTTVLAGTPPFVPPELVRSLSLDGRSDLFSLGATLYFALTKRQPFSARTFEQLQDAWRSTPPRPSSLVPEVPRALDDLILGMLRIDPGSRPKSAAEVMERLLPLLGAPPSDELGAARAYLSTPKLVGRDAIVARFRKSMMRAVRGHGGGFAVIGDEGTGRSRMVDAFVLEAKLVGATVVRAGREEATGPFGVAASLARQIDRTAPAVARAAAEKHAGARALLYPREARDVAKDGGPLADITRPELDRAAVQEALRAFILEFSLRRPLAIAIDDLDKIDEPSAALLASLTWEAGKRRLMYLAVLPTADEGALDGAVAVVKKHAEEIRLAPLSTEEVTALLASLFGDVPHLELLSSRFTALSDGRPRECMMFAQYLVEGGAITYGGGSWTLPAEIPDGLLPANLESAFARRVAQLGPLARHVAVLLAENLLDNLSRADILSLELGPSASIDAALTELGAARLVVGGPSGYALTGGAVARLLRASLDEIARKKIHDELATLHERAGRHALLVAYHACSGSRAGDAITRVCEKTPNTDERTVFVLECAELMGEARMARALEVTTLAAEALRRPPVQLQSLRAMLVGSAARGADPAYYYWFAPAWLRQSKRDSGYDDWLTLDPALDPSMRAMMAVSAAVQRYNETPEDERSQSPQEGIQQLVAYVLFTIAISSRVLDRDLMIGGDELLVPFAPLNPMVAAILTNARATSFHRKGCREHSQAAFIEVLKQLESVSGAELRYVEAVRAAVCFGLAAIETTTGVRSEWLSRLTRLEDRNQQVSALFLQKVAALHQGDWELAEKFRLQGELLSLQTKASSMFSTLADELDVHALARDLTGVRQARAGVRAMADKYPGYRTVQRFADAQYLRLCGDLEGALAELGPALAADEEAIQKDSWVVATRSLAVQLLCELGRFEESVAFGLSELARCETRGMRHQARGLLLSIAEAEARLGRFQEAHARVDAVLAEQHAIGVSGLILGHSYETAARVAIAERDAEAFRRFAGLAKEQYQPGKSSVLGALYERLMDEARKAGLIDFAPTALTSKMPEHASKSGADLATLMSGCEDPRERAERALGLLCDGEPPTRGHLFVLKSSGLALVASNTPCASVTEIVSFASECLDRENRANEMETGALSTESLGTLSAEWRDGDGLDYEVVLLATTISGSFCIGGIALLARDGEPRAGKLAPLAEAVARTLIAAGDAITIAAA